MLQNWRVWTPTETGREHAMVKIPPMIGSGIQRRHAAIFGESPENIGQLSDTFDRWNSEWMFLKINGLTKTGKWTVYHKIEIEQSFKNAFKKAFINMKKDGLSKAWK